MAVTRPDVDLADAIWRKSSYSSPTSNDCVEVAGNIRGIVAVRDSKHPDGPKLSFGRADWQAFAERVQRGTLDR